MDSITKLFFVLIILGLFFPRLIVAYTLFQTTDIDSIFIYHFDQKEFKSYPVTMGVSNGSGVIGVSEYGVLNSAFQEDFDDFLNPDTTILHRVLDHFNAMDYPFSSAVKLQMIRADSLVNRCSGLVISDYWIVTASHCSNIRETHFNNWSTDSVNTFLASPTFHNGTPHPTLGSIDVDMAIFFKARSAINSPDIIFFRLTKPIGRYTGTVELKASAMQNMDLDSSLLTFGYPGRHIRASGNNDYSVLYNADTLYFSQNKIQQVNSSYIFAKGHSNPGQSGSPVLVFQHGQLTSYGVMSLTSLDSYRASYIADPVVADNVQHLLAKYHPTTTSIHDEHAAPTHITLNQNYPNPFNSSTTIIYELAEMLHVRLEIVDVLGRTSELLVDQVQQSGRYTVSFNARDYSSGVLLYRIHVGNHILTRKMTLIK